MNIISPWTIQARSGGGAPAAVNTLSLAHFNGLDGVTTTTDAVAGITWTLNTSELDTAAKQFGTASWLESAAGGYGVGGSFTSPHLGDWTVEGFVFSPDLILKNPQIFLSTSAEASVARITLTNISITAIYTDSGLAEFLTQSGVIIAANSTWYHIAMVRSGTSYFLYFNGNRIDSDVSATNVDTGPKIIVINNAASGAVQVDEVRVSKVARYTGATYTIPTAEFTID